MATVVLVHGIAQEQKSADGLEAEWVLDLAGGVRIAGAAAVADALRDRRVDSRMAFYGDIFLRPGAMGPGDEELTDDEAELAQLLMTEWMDRGAHRSENMFHREEAHKALAETEGGAGEAMGVRDWGRRLLAATAKISWFAPHGMAFAQTFLKRSLKQVTSYLTNPDVNEEIRGRVHALIGDPATTVIVGHSLGSVVAYEVAAELGGRLPLLVTIGSPLGLDTVVYDRINPHPPVFPSAVGTWLNAADTDDLVAAEPDLARKFSASKPPGSELICTKVDNGAKPHSAGHYLTKAVVGASVATALQR